jgi:hypothetical protein
MKPELKASQEIDSLPVNDKIKGMIRWLNRPPSKWELAERERKEHRHQERLAAAQRELEAQRLSLKERGLDYPLEVCEGCERVVGWLSEPLNGLAHSDPEGYRRCLDCLSKNVFGKKLELELIYHPLIDRVIRFRGKNAEEQIEEALRRLSDPSLSLRVRALRRLGRPRRYQLEQLRNWRRFVGESWREEPPLGMIPALWGAEKTEAKAPDASGRLILFKIGRYRWQGDHWQRLRRSPSVRPQTKTPTVFSASLPLEQLLDAWADFQRELAKRNYVDWLDRERWRKRERERTALAAQRSQDERDRDLAGRGVADLF